MNHSKIPETDSIQELASFWDTHDLADFEDQLEEVTEHVFERETVVEIHLKADEAKAVKQLAQLKGISNADFIKELVREKTNINK